MPNVQQTAFGLAFKPQTDLQTINADGDFWKITRGTHERDTDRSG